MTVAAGGPTKRQDRWPTGQAVCNSQGIVVEADETFASFLSLDRSKVGDVCLSQLLAMPSDFFPRLFQSDESALSHLRIVTSRGDSSPDKNLLFLTINSRNHGEDERVAFEVTVSRPPDGLIPDMRKLHSRSPKDTLDEIKNSLHTAARPIAIANRAGSLEWLNAAAAEYLQVTKSELPINHVVEFTVKEDRARASLLFEQLLSGRLLSYSTVNRYRGSDGNTQWADVATTAIRNGDGQVAFAVAIITDIAEVPRLQQERGIALNELSARTLELKSKDTALREVLATIDDERQKYEAELRDSFIAVTEPILEWLEEADRPELEKQLNKLREVLNSVRDYGFGDQSTLFKRLSPRELEICEKIKEGLTSKQIADQMKISVETVNKHRFAIRRKLQLRNTHRNLASYLKQL